MARLTARENRYFLWTEPAEVPRARSIPGARPLPGGQRFDLPRKPGVILALDRVFGASGWEPASDVLQDAREARGRVYDPARESAEVGIEGAWLVVRCAISDKELVKRVPGYRWDPRRQRWFVPALPVALDLLREGFSQLHVDPEVETTIELRRLDQRRTEEQALRQATAPEAPPTLRVLRRDEAHVTAAGSDGPAERLATAVEGAADPAETTTAAVLERFDRLLTALERLVERLEVPSGGVALAARNEEEAPSSDASPTPPAPLDPGDEDWRDFLDRWEPDAGRGVQEALERARQAASPATWDAVAGILSHGAGQPEVARQHLRRALGNPTVEPELQSNARAAYTAASVALVARALHAETSVNTVQDLRAALHEEVLDGGRLDPRALKGGDLRDVIATLVDDPLLRELSPALADAVRVLDLLAGVRNDAPGIIDRLERFLVRDDTDAESSALTIMLAAAHVAGAETALGTIEAWPTEDVPAGLRVAPGLALARLQSLDNAETRGAAARAALFLSAGDASDETADGARRDLLRLIHRGDRGYEHASFLAWFPVAARGGALPEDRRDAYLSVLSRQPLRRSRDHIERMFAEGDERDRRGIVRHVAERAIVPALGKGIDDPQSEVIDLLDVFEVSDAAAASLGALAAAIDGSTFPGADRFTLEQRIDVFRRALKRAVAEHKKELALDGLARLTALLWECDRAPDIEEAARNCLAHRWAPIRVPASIALAEALAVQGVNPGDLLANLRDVLQGARDDERRVALLEAVGLVPELASQLTDELGPTLEKDEDRQPTLAGCRVLVVGGHDRLRQAATPVLERWQAKVDWLNPEQTKQGDRAVSLARGACTHVVVNTSYISHAASGRVIEAATGAGKPVIYHDGRGVIATLRFLGERLGDSPAGQPAADPDAKPTKADVRRQLAGLRRPPRHR